MQEVERLIVAATQPTGPGHRYDQLKRLAETLRSYNRGKDLNCLHSVVWDWWSLAKPSIKTKDWAATSASFERLWRGLKGSPLRWDAVLKDAATVRLPDHVNTLGYGVPLHQLLAVCIALQRQMDAIFPGLPFLISPHARRPRQPG